MFALICMCGGLGAVTRFVLNTSIQRWWNRAFPLSTFIINVPATFFAGVAAAAYFYQTADHSSYLLFVTGFLGGFSTFSTAINEMVSLARSGKYANAAVVVSVGGADFANDPRRAIAFQRELEAKAYAAGRAAGAYAAPAENVQSFLEGRGQLHIGSVQPTYDRGVTAADLGALLPGELADTLRAGLRAYERKIAGYTAPDAILTGLETRTSSPVRLKREEDFVCTQLAGLYPCGEGAGYAGGIMSAAVDGLRVARAIISRYAPAEG